MWGTVPNRAEMLEWAINFTGDHEKYGAAMIPDSPRPTHPNSPEVALPGNGRGAQIHGGFPRTNAGEPPSDAPVQRDEDFGASVRSRGEGTKRPRTRTSLPETAGS